MNIFILNSNYKRIGVLSNQGVNPKAPYFDDLYTQELDTSADTFYFSALTTSYTQDILEIGNHVTFEFNNQQKLFVISSLEFEHRDGMNVIGVYAEGAGFELLETYKKDIKLEQCSYSQFLAKILEGTSWKYKVSSGLAKNLQDVEYTQEKNVYAMLQDSMQTFQGVELEFEADYKNGALVKTIHAYENGGRGSFVGSRFEYGKNVKGIVKTQEVSNIKDEDIIFYEGLVTINGLQVEITYDVDFALKSAEVPGYNIGDTHYIIDNDFDPPMQIKGRIGKIEISFSDPTKNKIYLANFKKITGSKSEDTKEDDIKDIVDDYWDDKYGDDGIGDHKHNRLYDKADDSYYMQFSSLPYVLEWPGTSDMKEGNRTYLDFQDYDILTQVSSEYRPDHWLKIALTRKREFVGEEFDTSAGNDDHHGAEIFNSSGDLIPESNGKQDIGSSKKHWRNLYVDNIYTKNGTSISNGSNGTQIKSYVYALPFDREQMEDIDEITESSDVTKQDLLDYIINDVNIYKYMYSAEKEDNENSGITYSGQYFGLLSGDFFNHDAEANEIEGCATINPKVTPYIMRNVKNDGEDWHTNHEYNLPALVTALIGAFQQYVKNGGNGNNGNNGNDGNDGNDGSNGGGGISDTVENLTVTDTLTVPKIKQPNGTNYIEIDGDISVTGNILGNVDAMHVEGMSGEIGQFQVGSILPYTNSNSISIGSANTTTTIYGNVVFKGNVTGGGGTPSTGDTITVKKIIGGNPAYGEAPQYVEIEDALCVKKIFGGTDGGSVEWEGDLDVTGTASIYQDAHISGDLYVYGSIINGNGVAAMSSNNQEYYEEELRIRDEEIASLKDRLAKIEEMLGINNN